MPVEMPTLLALLGTVLMALAIFAPHRPAARVAAAFAQPATVQAAPPATTPREAMWPLLLDARAAGCDAAARCELVAALAAVRAPWSEAILVTALDEDPDQHVREAARAALAG